MCCVEYLTSHSFQLAAEIVDGPSGLHFDHIGDIPPHNGGVVYAWVERRKDGADRVLYAGKVGHRNSWSRRCQQHVGGFNGGSRRGRQHAANITSILETGNRVEVYAKVARTETLLGVANISLCDAEEEALKQQFQPPWNRL